MRSITVPYQVIRINYTTSGNVMFKIYIPQLYSALYSQFPSDDDIKHVQNVLHNIYQSSNEAGKHTMRLMISEIAQELDSSTGMRQIHNMYVVAEILTQCSFELNV